jgi:hypothetical protein
VEGNRDVVDVGTPAVGVGEPVGSADVDDADQRYPLGGGDGGISCGRGGVGVKDEQLAG